MAKEAIVFIEGLISFTDEATDFVSYIDKNKYDVILFDSNNRDKISYEEWKQQLITKYYAIISSYNAVHTIGYSFGSIIATYLLEIHQNKGKNILMCPPIKLVNLNQLISNVLQFVKDDMNFEVEKPQKKDIIERLKFSFHTLCLNDLKYFISLKRDTQFLWTDIKNPTLIIQGNRDWLSNFRGSENLFNKINSKNKSYINVDGGCHRLLTSYKKLRILAEIIAFLDSTEKRDCKTYSL